MARFFGIVMEGLLTIFLVKYSVTWPDTLKGEEDIGAIPFDVIELETMELDTMALKYAP